MSTLRNQIDEVLKRWAPKKPGYRDEFNILARQAIQHAQKHNDTAFLAELVMGVPSPTYQKAITKELEGKFQLELVPEKRYFRRKDKEALKNTGVSRIEILRTDTLGPAEPVTSVLTRAKRAPPVKVPEDVYNDMACFWFPEDRRFLRGLSEYVALRLFKAPGPGRLGKLSDAISSIPDQDIGSAIQHYLVQRFGLLLSEHGSLVLQKGRIEPTAISETFHEDFAAVVNRGRARSVLIGAERVPASDFANAVADIITENRSTFSVDDLAIMAEVIVLAANRARNSKNS